MNPNFFFRQMFELESSTYTYLLADRVSKEAVIIDPVLETLQRDCNLIDELGFKLKYVLDTHVHADHITAASELRKKYQAKTILSANAKVECMDIAAHDEEVFYIGPFAIKALETPGHTDGCMSYYVEGMVFTGDSLMIRSAGRTDFQQGSSSRLYHSVHSKLYTLPDETLLYPAHDYKGNLVSSIGEEKKFNPRIGLDKTEAEFCKIMSELKLSNPKKIHEAVPANLACGRKAL